MSSINLPFAASGDRRAPNIGELTAGFPCGKLDMELFNWLHWWTTGQIAEAITASGLTTDDAELGTLAEAMRSQALNYAVAGGTSNAITANLSPALLAYTDGLVLRIKPTAANSGAATLNVNGLGAKAIRKVLRSGEVALSAGDISASGAFVVMYLSFLNGGAGGFLLLNMPVGTAALENIGTSGANVPLLSTINTWGASQTANTNNAPSWSAVDTRNNVTSRMQAYETSGAVGTFSNHSFQFRTNGQVRATLANDGSTLAFAANLALAFAGGTGPATTRDNLGLGAAALFNVGTSGNVLAQLSQANTWGDTQTIQRTGANAALVLNRTDGSSVEMAAGAAGVVGTTTDHDMVVRRNASNRLLLSSAITEVLNSHFRVQDGASIFGRSGYSTSVAGISINNAGVGEIDSVTAAGNQNILLRKSGSGSSNYVQFYVSGTSLVGSISTNGSATAYNTTSDEEWKNFIGFYDPLKAIDIIRRDPVRDFTWKDGGEYAVGWGAQTSHAVSPDLASPGGWKDPITGEEWEEGGERWIDPITREPWVESGVRWIDPETREEWQEGAFRFYCDALDRASDGLVLWADPRNGEDWEEGGVLYFDPRTGEQIDGECLWVDPETGEDWEEGAFRLQHPETGEAVEWETLTVTPEPDPDSGEALEPYTIQAWRVEAQRLDARKVEAVGYPCRRIDAQSVEAQKVEAIYQPWGVDQSKRTPYLWAAVGWLLDERDALCEEVDELKTQLASVLLRLDALEAT